jgi:hypothetical protein
MSGVWRDIQLAKLEERDQLVVDHQQLETHRNRTDSTDLLPIGDAAQPHFIVRALP